MKDDETAASNKISGHTALGNVSIYSMNQLAMTTLYTQVQEEFCNKEMDKRFVVFRVSIFLLFVCSRQYSTSGQVRSGAHHLPADYSDRCRHHQLLSHALSSSCLSNCCPYTSLLKILFSTVHPFIFLAILSILSHPTSTDTLFRNQSVVIHPQHVSRHFSHMRQIVLSISLSPISVTPLRL